MEITGNIGEVLRVRARILAPGVGRSFKLEDFRPRRPLYKNYSEIAHGCPRVNCGF